MKRAASRWLIAVAAAFPLLCAYSCAVPLGPGYHIEKETVALSFASQPKPLLHLNSRYRLKNVGNGPLASLEVIVPEKYFVARQNLHITVDGKDARMTERLTDETLASVVQISFEPAWLPLQKRDIEITGDMAAGNNKRTVMALNAFAFDGDSWLPAFQAPKGLFAKGEQRGDLTDLSFEVPKDFLVAASGQPIGRKNHGETVEYRFRLVAKDGPPFVVAGRYKQQIVKSKGAPVYFWTFQGLPEDAAKSVGQQFAAAGQFFDSNFVARGRRESPLWVVEIPENQVFSLQDTIAATAVSFPSMILLGKDVLPQNIGRGQVSSNEIGLLSDTWVQWMASAKENEPILTDTLRAYMVDSFNESREGAPYRRMKIAEYLHNYDLSNSRAEEKPIMQTSYASGNGGQLDIAGSKAELFLYALEDTCGQAAFRRGIGVMISDLRGSQYGYEDLRAALKGECGTNANVDILFRAWLYEKSIPKAFRERYATAQEIR